MNRFASTLLLVLLAFVGQLGVTARGSGQLPLVPAAQGGAGLPGTAAAPRSGPLTLPAPRGLVNDFANVIPADRAARIEAIAQAVRDRSGGEIAVVTLPDIGDRDPGDVALQIGREWKVGSAAKIGNAARNAGTVILVVPKQTSSTGHGRVDISTGQGTEAFITDAIAGDIRREATPLLQQGDYGAGVQLITQRVAERYAQAFGFALDSLSADLPAVGGAGSGAPRYERVPLRSGGGGGINPVVLIVIFFVVVSLLSRLGGGGRRRGCGGCIPIFLPFGGGGGGSWGGGGWGGGGSWGGGGGGGGFGGFGGGGGFSGGGSGGDF